MRYRSTKQCHTSVPKQANLKFKVLGSVSPHQERDAESCSKPEAPEKTFGKTRKGRLVTMTTDPFLVSDNRNDS